MRRRGLIAWLLGSGVASAQAMRLEPSGEMVRVKPLNGTCPACGTKRTFMLPGSALSLLGNPTAGYSSPMPSHTADITGKLLSMQVRCEFCSAAFWQDAK